eukprot:916376-Rhodomonas_salina.1
MENFDTTARIAIDTEINKKDQSTAGPGSGPQTADTRMGVYTTLTSCNIAFLRHQEGPAVSCVGTKQHGKQGAYDAALPSSTIAVWSAAQRPQPIDVSSSMNPFAESDLGAGEALAENTRVLVDRGRRAGASEAAGNRGGERIARSKL